MDYFSFNIGNKDYLDEKELFILFYLLKNKSISTLWSNVFVPNPREELIKPSTTSQELWDRINYRGQSSIVLKYLLDLGKTLDEDNFLIKCNAAYALDEGGFLTNKSWTDSAEDSSNDSPIDCYQECILDKKASKEFIDLVNKLITENNNGVWETKDTEDFLALWYKENKTMLISKEEGIFYENNQKKLARLLFENIDIHLYIKETGELESFLNNYLTLFKENKLKKLSNRGLTKHFFSAGISADFHKKYFGFERQKEILVTHIEKTYNDFRRQDLEITSPFVAPEYIEDDDRDTAKKYSPEESIENESFLFVHTILTLDYDKEVEIDSFYYGAKSVLDIYDKGFVFNIIIKKSLFNNNIIKEKTYFDPDKSILFIGEKEVKFRKFTEQYHTLRIIFENKEDLKEEWFFSKIGEEIDIGKGYTDKHFHNYISAIKRKIAAETGIKDFFITTTQSVKINKDYLK